MDNPEIQSLEGEVWKDVKEWSGYYQISDKARVKSLRRTILRKDGTFCLVKERIVILTKNLAFGVTKNNKNTPKRVHREMARAFVANPDNLPDVKFIDGNRSNIIPENLKWFNSNEIIKGKQELILKDQRKNARQEHKIKVLKEIKQFAVDRGGECLSD